MCWLILKIGVKSHSIALNQGSWSPSVWWKQLFTMNWPYMSSPRCTCLSSVNRIDDKFTDLRQPMSISECKWADLKGFTNQIIIFFPPRRSYTMLGHRYIFHSLDKPRSIPTFFGYTSHYIPQYHHRIVASKLIIPKFGTKNQRITNFQWSNHLKPI